MSMSCYSVHKTCKFSPKATRSNLMGYETTQKGYKLYDLEHHTFVISRDVVYVVFTEIFFPFQTHSTCV